MAWYAVLGPYRVCSSASCVIIADNEHDNMLDRILCTLSCQEKLLSVFYIIDVVMISFATHASW